MASTMCHIPALSRAQIAQSRPRAFSCATNTAKAAAQAPTRGSLVQAKVFGGLFGGGKIDDSKSYICIDCGYIYDQREPFSAVPASFKCPACTSTKKRFKAYKGDVSGRIRNDNKSMVARIKAKQW